MPVGGHSLQNLEKTKITDESSKGEEGTESRQRIPRKKKCHSFPHL
jgi:hypothetical protein